MTKAEKDLRRILDGRYDRSIDFALLIQVLRRLGFSIRVEGSHIICSHPNVQRSLTLQAQGKGRETVPGSADPTCYSGVESSGARRMKYEVNIYWSEEDQVFIAEVPDLPGCMTHGDTYEAAVAMVEEAMRGWISAWEEMGREIPEPRLRALTA